MANQKIKILEVMSNVFDVDLTSLNEESSIDSIENWDSIRHLNLILALEEEFNITIPNEEVGDLVSYKLIEIIVNEQSK
jgi:acyl carrier protein